MFFDDQQISSVVVCDQKVRAIANWLYAGRLNIWLVLKENDRPTYTNFLARLPTVMPAIKAKEATMRIADLKNKFVVVIEVFP